jgi:hypothetical protein
MNLVTPSMFLLSASSAGNFPRLMRPLVKGRRSRQERRAARGDPGRPLTALPPARDPRGVGIGAFFLALRVFRWT